MILQFDSRPTTTAPRSTTTSAAISDERLEMLMARGERDRGFIERQVTAKYVAPYVKVQSKASRPRPVHATQIRPCPTCGHLTRTSKAKLANHPGTRVRGGKGICTPCIWEAKRAPGMKRHALPPLDVSLIVDLYSVGLGGPQIARELGVDEGRISRAILAAGVVKRSRSEAMLAIRGRAA